MALFLARELELEREKEREREREREHNAICDDQGAEDAEGLLFSFLVFFERRRKRRRQRRRRKSVRGDSPGQVGGSANWVVRSGEEGRTDGVCIESGEGKVRDHREARLREGVF